MVLSVISSGMEFVRGLVLEKRGDVMRQYALQRCDMLQKRNIYTWMDR
jgi:hypothetical protein